ncbi:hypothetical protein JCM8097_000996 [Rhodosporidiobolus ruineniae]
MLCAPSTSSAAPRPALSSSAAVADIASLEEVARQLAKEVALEQDRLAAERLQLELTLAESRPASPRLAAAALEPSSSSSALEPSSSYLVSLRLQLDAVNSSLSRAAIPHIARQDHQKVADHMRAERLAKEVEDKLRQETADAIYAKALQKVDDEGKEDIDDEKRRTAEGVLGEEKVREFMNPPSRPDASTLAARPALPHGVKRSASEEAQGSSKGKGKARAVDVDLASSSDEVVFFEAPHASTSASASSHNHPDPRLATCSICFESCRPVTDPYSASLNGGSSFGPSYGIFLGKREDKHVLCLGCSVTYLIKRLEEKGRKSFPVRCVECPYELTDLDAQHLLGPENLDAWHFRKLLDTQDPLYCPNPRCSIRVLRHDDPNQPQAVCPACRSCICTACDTFWHTGMTCEKFQKANAEDFAVLELAKTKGWKRCPGCKTMVEHAQGCFHMTCDCGREWCYRCEGPCAAATRRQQQRLQQQQQQQQPQQQQPQQQQPQQQQRRQPPPPPPAQFDPRLVDFVRRANALDFVVNADHVPRHAFTEIFLRDNECGYCQLQFASPAALLSHLASTPPHPVYSCCGRFYRALAHLDQHVDANRRAGHGEYVWEP